MPETIISPVVHLQIKGHVSKGGVLISPIQLFTFDFKPFGKESQAHPASIPTITSGLGLGLKTDQLHPKPTFLQSGSFQALPTMSPGSSSILETSSRASSSNDCSTEKQMSTQNPLPLATKPNVTQSAADARKHMALLQQVTRLQDNHEITGTPIFTTSVLEHSPELFSQYGFFGGISDKLDSPLPAAPAAIPSGDDPRLFFNIAAPSSVFICGSQGSGKSHTLTCLLENCLMKSAVSRLHHPLAGLVFHYDTFTSDHLGTPCEAAHLSSNPAIKVRVLCSPTNIRTIERTYEAFRNIKVEPLRISQDHLNTKRMMDLMAVNTEDGSMPLYLHKIIQILRDMRIVQQETGSSFNYAEFKQQVTNSPMTPAQLAPLSQRLDTLESFMPKSQTQTRQAKTKRGKIVEHRDRGNDWAIKPGTLTVVDLSCPCVTSADACALFNMCLSLFLEQKTTTGRVVALDEAHKYMNSTGACEALTSTLLTTVRLQRHLGTRVFISTQEPTVSPALLDLCSITIVHRFSSPSWLGTLKSHLAALSHEDHITDIQAGNKSNAPAVFKEVVTLRVGEALLFSPSAIVDMDVDVGEDAKTQMVKLGTGYLKIKIRARLTHDGGKSVMAT